MVVLKSIDYKFQFIFEFLHAKSALLKEKGSSSKNTTYKSQNENLLISYNKGFHTYVYYINVLCICMIWNMDDELLYT